MGNHPILIVGFEYSKSHFMEAELIKHLELLLASYRTRRDLQPSTIGRLGAGDGKFFERLRSGATFTVKKYDSVVGWFSVNWPEGLEWPVEVPHPAAPASVEASK